MSQYITVVPVKWRNQDEIRIPLEVCTSVSALKAAIRKALGPEAQGQVIQFVPQHAYVEVIYVNPH